MSYILDALKKADAERERGTVPGLHAQPEPLVMEPLPSGGRLGTVAWVVAALLGVLVVLVGWRVLGSPDGAPEPVATAVPVPTPAQSPAPAPATMPAHVPPAPVVAAAPVLPKPSAPAAWSSSTERRGAAAPKPTPAPGPAQAPAQDERRVYAQRDLPDEVRRDLPPIVVSGAMYSETPSGRMLIVNSQVFHEGDHPTPELTLDEIKLKSAVFRFRGYRYAVNY